MVTAEPFDMDFPKRNFPYVLNQHERQREIFADFGTHSGVDVQQNNGILEFITQKCTSEVKTSRLLSRRPTLPLNPEPEEVIFPYRDRIMDELNDIKRICADLKHYVRFTGRYNKTVFTKELEDILERIEKIEKLKSNKSKLMKLQVPERVEKIVNKYKQCKFIQEVKSNAYHVVRGELKTHVYMMDIDQSVDQWSPTLVQEMTFTDCRPTSVCLSPYIPGECLTATDNGTVKLCTADKRCEVVVDKQTHRFECYDQWRQCRFGAHPRQIILADNTAVQIFDIRTSYRKGTDLFALPSKYLNKRERIRVVEQHPVSPFLYVIVTDYSMCLLDLRFPNNPLLQWQHLLRTPPSYISCLTNVGQENQNHVFIASQSPSDVCCYTFNYKHSEAPRSLVSPWKLSKISDFTKWPEICGGADRILVEDRLMTSLAGITSVDSDKGYTAYQLDSHGDIFYQVYEESESTDRKQTYNWRPGSDNLYLDEISVKIGKKWIQNLEAQVFKAQKEIAEMRKNTGTDVTSLFDEIMTDHPAHVLCSLCMPKSKPYNLDMDQGEICHNCQESLQASNSILQSVNKDTITTTSTQQNNTFDDDISQTKDLETSDALSQLMDEDIKMRRSRLLKKNLKETKCDESHYETDSSDIEGNISLDSCENMEQSTTGTSDQLKHIKEQRVLNVEHSHHSHTDDSHHSHTVDSHHSHTVDLHHSHTVDSHHSHTVDSHYSHTVDEYDSQEEQTVSNRETEVLSCLLKNRDRDFTPDKFNQVSLRKRRHSGSSSISSLSSIISSKSSQIPGFATTPIKHKLDIIRNSPNKSQHQTQSMNYRGKK
ncbi:hypothetical protein KUTeg_018518 [Tegillarca granosa]|uniref:TAF1C beta-propeller domain-containing protein n=1 Tax=Tegillarca granosa TaxID=220873 RepID=A0ABQ9ENH4_TEGGR|nr:hypothetical protein KUTeg_018518 [Tegillarca granosa]